MLRLAFKALRLFLSDRRTVILGFLVPIALISLFAFAFGGIGQSDNEPRAVSLLFADEDQSKASKDMIARLDSLKEYEVWTTTTDSAETNVKKGDEAAVLVIRKGFGDSLSANASLPHDVVSRYPPAHLCQLNIG